MLGLLPLAFNLPLTSIARTANGDRMEAELAAAIQSEHRPFLLLLVCFAGLSVLTPPFAPQPTGKGFLSSSIQSASATWSGWSEAVD